MSGNTGDLFFSELRDLQKLSKYLGPLHNTIGLDPQNPKEPIYAFFHATFQEYFAARTIGDWDFFFPKEHKNKPVEKIDKGKYLNLYRIFYPQWKEVILLWLGREDIKDKDKVNFIQALESFEDGCGGYFNRRSLFLSSIAASEVKIYPRKVNIFSRIINLAFLDREEKEESLFYSLIPSRHDAELSLFEMDLNIAKSLLFESICSTENDLLKLQASIMLIQMGDRSENLKKSLFDLLESSLKDWIKISSAENLIKIKGDSNIIEKKS